MTIRAARVAAYAATVVVLASAPAPALASTSLQMNATPRLAEVGVGIRVELSAMTDDGPSPSNPRLDVPAGVTVEGPSISTSQQISFTNGSFVHRHGITATWVVSGTRAGRFTVGPATVQVGQSVLRGETVSVEIVPPGAAPSRPRQRSRGGFFDPFDPFGGFPKLPGFDDDDDEPDPFKQLTVPDSPPPEYVIPKAPDPVAFVRAVAEPTRAVVGQEIRFRVYGYGGRGAWEEASSSEPSRADFLSQTIVDVSARQRPVFVDIEGQRFIAKKARDVALFPLKAGALVVGPMSFGFRGRGYPETRPGAGLVRSSEPVTISVSEPPMAGRPPGYQLGDVGAYTLTAEVDPRRVEAGGAIAVTVRLEGTGNVPRHVKVPESRGAEWDEPTTSEAITPTDRGISGWRQFRYVVTLTEPGTRELGEVTLPFWDPSTATYQAAKAALGSVEVIPGVAPASPPPAAASAPPPKETRDALSDLTPRRALSGSGGTDSPLTERRELWLLLLLLPLGVLSLRGVLGLLRHTQSRLAERAGSKSVLSKKALEEARIAAGKREASAVAAAVERAVYFTIEDRLGLKARAVLRGQLSRELERAGCTKDVAEETVMLLDDCERLRFGGAGQDLSNVAARAAAVVGKLARVRPSGRGELAA